MTKIGLTIGTLYYVRIATTFNPTGSTSSSLNGFNICITNAAVAPSNDDCSGAFSLTSSSGCIAITGTLINATPSGLTSCAANITSTSADVWYSFVAQTAYPVITVNEGFPSGGNAGIELYSSCGGSPLGCASNTFTTSSVIPAGLSIGSTYYVRIGINKSIGIPTSGTYGFTICVTENPNGGASVDFGKSYINITKGGNGGTIDPGDILEIRATLVVSGSGKSIDSVAYYDTLLNTKGFALVPGSISLRTNEGKIYKSY